MLIDLLVNIFLLALLMRLNIRERFYRGYFEEKQRNLGKDPSKSIREALGSGFTALFF